MSRFPMRLAALAALAAPLLLASCVQRFQSDQLRDVDVSYKGGPLPKQMWEESEKKLAAEKEKKASEPTGRLFKGSSTSWILPGFFQYRQLLVEPEEATTHRGSWVDLLSPMFLSLPLCINYQEHYYAPNSTESQGSRSITWSPIWANAVKEGTVDRGREFQASGVPLLWSTFRVRDNHRPLQVSGFTTLWSLGTASIHGKDPKWEGYFTAPLLLGGLIGSAVWSDACIKVHGSEGAAPVRAEWHGPFMGFLGYQSYRGPEDFDPEKGTASSVTRARKLALGGLIWYDGSRYDEKGALVKSAHGPLWTLFGWGVKDGKKHARVFGISI